MDETRALKFLTNVLQFTEEELALKKDQKQAFLKLFVKRFYENEPFTNYPTLLYRLDPEKSNKKVPKVPVEWVLNELENRKGGACYVLSLGAALILQHLGFDTYVTNVYVENRPGRQTLHFAVVVKDLEKSGDRYFIDLGTRISPLMHPIPLHDLIEEGQESECYDSFYMFSKFVREGDVIIRYTGKVEEKPKGFYFYKIDPEPAEVNMLSDDGEDIEFARFPSPTKSDNPAVERNVNFWVEMLFIVGFPNGKPCVFRNLEKRHMDSEGKIVRTILPNREELIEELTANYPQYGAETIKESIEKLWDMISSPRE